MKNLGFLFLILISYQLTADSVVPPGWQHITLAADKNKSTIEFFNSGDLNSDSFFDDGKKSNFKIPENWSTIYSTGQACKRNGKYYTAVLIPQYNRKTGKRRTLKGFISVKNVWPIPKKHGTSCKAPNKYLNLDNSTEAGKTPPRCEDCETETNKAPEYSTNPLNELSLAHMKPSLRDLRRGGKYERSPLDQLGIDHAKRGYTTGNDPTERCWKFADYKAKNEVDDFKDNPAVAGLIAQGQAKNANGKQLKSNHQILKEIGQVLGLGDLSQSCDHNQSKGRCYQGLRTLINKIYCENVILNSDTCRSHGYAGPGPMCAQATGAFKSHGFEDFGPSSGKSGKITDPRNCPIGGVLLYKDPRNPSWYGHAEVFTGKYYCSDFCRTNPISERNSDNFKRELVGCWVKTKHTKECN